MGLSVPQYFNNYVVTTGRGPVNTPSSWVCIKSTSLHSLPSLALFLFQIIQFFAKFEIFLWINIMKLQDKLCTLQFNNMLLVIFTSPATVAFIIALFLDSTLGRSHSLTRKDSGRHWWGRFRHFDDDPRSAEFYSLPYGLSKYFPSI